MLCWTIGSTNETKKQGGRQTASSSNREASRLTKEEAEGRSKQGTKDSRNEQHDAAAAAATLRPWSESQI